jgi:hypothetical protein
MAQLTVRGNLSAANFPFVSDFWGRTVIIAQYDMNYIPPQSQSGADADRDRGIPQLFYAQNVLPDEQGYKSVSTVGFIRNQPATTNFTSGFIARDPSETKCFIGFTITGKVWMYKSFSWIDVTPAFAWPGGEVSYGFANGYTYICFAGYGIYKVDIAGSALIHPAWAGIVDTAIIAITGSVNYLIACTGTIAAWSSTANPEDFTPSLITGAGSGTPNDLAGLIIAAVPFGNGFAIYSTQNIILAAFSGNTRFPWVFRNANNGAGITSKESVAFEGDLGNNYAWTSAGLLKVASTGCIPEFPSATDFLAGKIFEDYDYVTDVFTQTYLTSQLSVKMAFVGSRYIVISYGLTSALTHALIYDTALRRWGKVKVDHVDVIDIEMSSAGGTLTYAALTPTTYTLLAGVPYSELRTLSQIAAMPKYNMGFMKNTGEIIILDAAFGDTTAQGVCLLGKYQLSRNQAMCSLQMIDVENAAPSSGAMDVRVLTTIDGKTFLPAVTPTLAINSGNFRRYTCRTSGMNHSIVYKGAIHLASHVLTFARGGRR